MNSSAKCGKTLVKEVNDCQLLPNQCAFWWIGQIGYIVKLGSKVMYLDPFLSNMEGRRVPPLLTPEEITNADYIFGSHDHIDHIDRACWKQLSESSPSAKFIVPKVLLPGLAKELKIEETRFIGLDDGLKLSLEGNISITGIASAHEFLDKDEKTGEYPYLGIVVEGNGCKIYHSGDTCIYEGLIQKLREQGKYNAMFLPINGRDGKRLRDNILGNMTYQEAVDLAGVLQPALVVPAHYEMFEFNQEDVDKFVDYLEVKYPCIPCWVGEHGVKVLITN